MQKIFIVEDDDGVASSIKAYAEDGAMKQEQWAISEAFCPNLSSIRLISF